LGLEESGFRGFKGLKDFGKIFFRDFFGSFRRLGFFGDFLEILWESFLFLLGMMLGNIFY
jgi:hypothetical protein